MTMRLAPVLLSLAAGCCAQAQVDPAFRVNVRLVRILATVKDDSGALVGNLDKSAFTIRDNGALQDLAVFERQTDQPLSVAVLIDNSGSTAKDLRFEADSVSRFVRAILRDGNPADAVALYSFNWEIVRQNGYTRNVAAIERSLHGLHGEAGTSLYDAILLASRDIEEREGRKILVIVTDGGDTTSRSDFQRATETAQLADAVIYPVLIVPVTNPAGRNVGGENALTTLALRTGGRVFQPTLGMETDRAFDQILRDLRTQYLLGFYPKDAPLTKDRFHALQITVPESSLRVTARSGYYGEALQNAAPVYAGSSSAPVAEGSGETARPLRKPVPAAKPKGKGP